MAAYGNLCTAFYDLDKPSAPADALAFYAERARSAGGRVLEPMCGSGRFLLPMAQAGLQIDGVDSSPEMLAACRARAQQIGVPVNVHLQDLTELALPHQYALAFIPAGSIGLITDDRDLHQVLSRIHAHLVPNGTLLLEFVNDSTESVSPTAYAPRSVECGDGSSITYTCSASRTTSPDTIRYSGTYTKHHGSQVIETEAEELSLRLHDVKGLSAALASCGFNVTKVSDASDLPFLAASGCTLMEARAAASQPAPAIDLVRLFGFLGGAPGTTGRMSSFMRPLTLCLLLHTLAAPAAATKPAWSTDVYFGAGRDVIEQVDRVRIASAISGVPGSFLCASGTWILVGHADPHEGPPEAATSLSERRARAVAAELRAAGVSDGTLEVAFKGSTQPVAKPPHRKIAGRRSSTPLA